MNFRRILSINPEIPGASIYQRIPDTITSNRDLPTHDRFPLNKNPDERRFAAHIRTTFTRVDWWGAGSSQLPAPLRAKRELPASCWMIASQGLAHTLALFVETDREPTHDPSPVTPDRSQDQRFVINSR